MYVSIKDTRTFASASLCSLYTCRFLFFLLAVTNTGNQIRGLIRDDQLRVVVLDVCYEAARRREIRFVSSKYSTFFKLVDISQPSFSCVVFVYTAPVEF